MTAPDSTRKAVPPEAGPAAATLSVPVRRSRWVSFWVGLAALFCSMLTAAALAGSLLLLPTAVLDGVWVILIFAVLWGGLFFLSLPWQTRYARSRDLRRPGIRLAGGVLAVPVRDGDELRFDFGARHELTFGWHEVLNRGGGAGGPTTNTRGLMTYAILSQSGRGLFLLAEDSVREARAAGWPNRTSPETPDLRVRLWASDLVTLVEALRTAARTPAPTPRMAMTKQDGGPPPERIREWPENPLPARNRHEATLFLEWMKAEVVSRAPCEGGEVCVGRVPGVDPAVAPDTYRFVFSLLGPDPEDEHDYGPGLSQIFDPADLMLFLSRMEREELFGPGGSDAGAAAASVLTHRTTREVAAVRRANARGRALVEQTMRFAEGEDRLAEETVKGSTKRTWFRGARARFEMSALEAKRRAFSERARLLELPAAGQTGPGEEDALLRELRGRCPTYLSGLRRAGFEDGQVRHPLFSHAYHLTRFAARAICDGEAEQARAAFDAWAAAEPRELLFPVREFAEAAYEMKLEPADALPFVPPGGRHSFSTFYDALVEPDYNPWSY